MGLIWQSFRNWKRKHWFCHLQSFNGQPKLWFSDPKVVQLWAGKLELRLSSKIGWVGDSNGWDKLTHIPKPKQYDVKEGVLSSERMKNEQTVTHIFHTSNIYQLVWLVTTTTQSWAEKVPIHCWWNYLTIRIHIPVFVWQAPQFLLVKPSNLNFSDIPYPPYPPPIIRPNLFSGSTVPRPKNRGKNCQPGKLRESRFRQNGR